MDLNGHWDGAWRLPGETAWRHFTATVPGCLHTDLMAADVVPELFWRDTAQAWRRLETAEAVYTREFIATGTERDPVLIFEGLDVYAQVYLNGQRLGECDDMFIPWEFPVAGLLREGVNRLEVRFASPVTAVQDKRERWGAFTLERLYTRRLQCTYGWDWVERLVTLGIWKPVRLVTDAPATVIRDVYVYTDCLTRYGAQVGIEVTAQGSCDGSCRLTVELHDPEGTAVHRESQPLREPVFTRTVSVPDARLWYPNGYGAQPLYTLLVELALPDGIVQKREIPFGIRTVTVWQAADAPDSAYAARCRALQQCSYLESAYAGRLDRNETFSGFTVLVNDTPVFCMGADWVPTEPFPSAEQPEKVERLLTLARQAGVNMLRVWGGGLFESEQFYTLCDRLGILVTQDLLMACGSYPEEDAHFMELLGRETEHAARRLRNHPSLAWWCGDNENGIDGTEQEPYNGRRAALEIAAPVLRRLDGRRMFLPTSPYGGDRFASATVGTTHNTKFLGALFRYIREEPLTDYAAYIQAQLSRFNAELPVMGAAGADSLSRFMTREDIYGADETMWKYHSKVNPALGEDALYGSMRQMAEKIYGGFRDGADRLRKLEYLQYDWIRLSLEVYRRHRGFTAGALFWMYNDCWPAALSWSLVDYYGCPKAGYYSFARAARPVLAAIDPSDSCYRATVCNLHFRPVSGTVTVSRIDAAGVRTVLYTGGFTAAGEETATVWTNETDVLLQPGEFLFADIAGAGFSDRAWWHEGTLAVRPEGGTVAVSHPDDRHVDVCATGFVLAVELAGAAVFGDNFFPLYPGETRRIGYSPIGELTPSVTADVCL